MRPGRSGINNVHLFELSPYGVTVGKLLDGYKFIYLVGWHLRNEIKEPGYTWKPVGAYNSKAPSKRGAYALTIRLIIDF